jgi:starch synthase
MKPVAAYEVSHANGPVHAEVYETRLDGLPVYLIGGPPFGDEPAVYTANPAHDSYRFIFFSLAALELGRVLEWQPDILHAHDWHTAAAVYALQIKQRTTPRHRRVRSVLTVHNLPYLGNDSQQEMANFGLPSALESDLPEWAQQLPLPVGLWAADRITTVSEGYAAEVQTPEFGAGLDTFLRPRQGKISGVLNGLDTKSFNPLKDSAITQLFGRSKLPARAVNKNALQNELNLEVDAEIPLLAMIGRMDMQKGVDVALDAMQSLETSAWQMVLLGTGDPMLEDAARSFAAELPERVRAIIRFDAQLARRIYAGADMILIPSRYEPCGLTQMIAMRYGCVPIARAVGGLKDTIEEIDLKNNTGTGFLYNDQNPQALGYTIQRALDTFADAKAWAALQKRGMAQDFSWKQSAEKYLTIYQDLI